MTVKLLYKTDHHHSYDSRDIIGVFTNQTSFRREVRKIITKEINNSSDVEKEDKENQINFHVGFCLDKKQTQGLPEFELVWEEFETNKII